MENTVFDCLSRGTAIYNIYAVCVSDMGNGLFEILDTTNLLKDINEQKNYGIVALVHGKKAAILTVKGIISDWYAKNGSLDGIRGYYSSRCD